MPFGSVIWVIVVMLLAKSFWSSFIDVWLLRLGSVWASCSHMVSRGAGSCRKLSNALLSWTWPMVFKRNSVRVMGDW